MITTPSAALVPSSRSPRGASCRAADGSLYAGVAQQAEHPPCKWVVASSTPAAGSTYRLSIRTGAPLCNQRGNPTLAEAPFHFAAMGAPHCAGSKSTPARFLNDSAVKPETRDGSRAGTRARPSKRLDAESPIQGGLFEREDLPRRTDAEVEAWLRDLPF